MKVYLIGMPLSGKSTIGKLLSKRLNLEFIDLDSLIEDTYNETIRDMFIKGEEYFRNKETETLKTLMNKDNIVVSCGGGIVLKEENLKYLNGKVVYLDVSVKELEKRFDINNNTRPLLNTKTLNDLYLERKDKYLHFSNIVICNNNIEDSLEKIEAYLDENISN